MKKVQFSILLALLFCFNTCIANAWEPVPFKGQWGIQDHELRFFLGEGDPPPVGVTIQEQGGGNYTVRIEVEHLKISVFEISTEMENRMSYHAPAEGSGAHWTGEVSSQYSLINGKPVDEFSGKFALGHNRLELTAMKVGTVELSGTVDLAAPFRVNLKILLSEIPMRDFLAFWLEKTDLAAQGKVSGVIQVGGTLGAPVLKGNLTSLNGTVGDADFDKIQLVAEGGYPVLTLSGSRMSQADGLVFNIDGKVDLSNRENFRKEIRALKKSPVVSSDRGKLEWKIKSRPSGEKNDGEFVYFLRTKSGDNPFKEDSEMLGVEQKIKF